MARIIPRRLAAAAATAVLAGAPLGPLPSAHAGGAPKAADGAGGAAPKMAGDKYVNLDLFAVPFLTNGQPDGQLNIAIALELSDIDRRIFVLEKVPRIRAAVYDALLANVTNRSVNKEIPSNDRMKRFLRAAAKKALGEDLVSDVLIQQIYENRPAGR